MQARDAEDYNKLKIKLETDVQVLEQQLELMRSTYLLNTEKLEYNYRVLTEKYAQNHLIPSGTSMLCFDSLASPKAMSRFRCSTSLFLKLQR